MLAEKARHIDKDQQGRAIVEGTRMRVSMIARDTEAGLSPRDIHDACPDLSLAQIHAALAHYYDHQSQVDAEIRSEDEFVSGLRDEAEKRGAP